MFLFFFLATCRIRLSKRRNPWLLVCDSTIFFPFFFNNKKDKLHGTRNRPMIQQLFDSEILFKKNSNTSCDDSFDLIVVVVYMCASC